MDARNPFEPPRAAVADPALAPMARPAAIDRAFWLIIASAVLGLASYLTPELHVPLLTMAFTLGWLVGFAFLLRAGQNWARIVFLVVFALGCVGIAFLLPTVRQFGTSHLVVMCVQTGLQGYALWLVFSAPGNAWFRRSRATQA